MADASSPSSSSSTYPVIDPTAFDLIVSGTGLPASLLAAAAATSGKSVLHIDPNSFYGSHFASLSPSLLPSFLSSSSSCYSSVDISGTVPDPPGSFLLDLHGPRLLFCADRTVDLMIRSGASHHVDFRSVDGSLIYWEGRLNPVPDSRQAVFKDRSLGLAEKSQLMRFLRLVQAHLASGDEIPEEDLEMSFSQFLEKQQLPPRIKMIVLYAIALADYEQESCERPIKTREGIESIALYTSSIGRLHNAVGAFIYPIYGLGELPQAFCRCAAVKGALYVLRMPMVDVLTDKEDGHCKGVKLASGQEMFSQNVVIDPSFTVPSPISSSMNCECLNTSNETRKVARGICITNCSLEEDLLNILVTFPPRSLHSEQFSTVRALQLSSNVAVCPPGMFVVYLSVPCDNAIQGKEYILLAMDALLKQSSLNPSDGSTSPKNEGSDDSKPTILWKALYIQELTQASFDALISCPLPDASLDYRNLLEATLKLFSNMYPNEEFFPYAPASEDTEDVGSFD